jgi:hypothetical protein
MMDYTMQVRTTTLGRCTMYNSYLPRYVNISQKPRTSVPNHIKRLLLPPASAFPALLCLFFPDIIEENYNNDHSLALYAKKKSYILECEEEKAL